MSSWDHEVDVLVVGSGNGAMTAAIAAKDLADADVLVIEKADKFGGTSALSGGGVWVPNNRYAKEAGMVDSFDDAFTYLKNTIPEDVAREDMIEAYLKAAPEMVDFLHNNTHMRYVSLEKYPDYYSDLPGAKNGHRSMEPEYIMLTELGEDIDNFNDGGTMYMFYKFALTQVEAQVLIGRLKGWLKIMGRMVLEYYTDFPWLLKRKGFSRKTTGGGAGIVRLFLSMRDRGIPLWLKSPMKELVVEGGKVVGVVIEKDGKPMRIRAKRGVILAAGGFEMNQQMREQYLPKPTNTQWSAGCKTNTGDAIQAAEKIGAKLGLMDNAWWCTTKVLPDRPYPFLSIINKSLPGSIVVNSHGDRFSNESQNYMAFLQETFAKHTDEKPCVPMYMVFDEDFRKQRNVWPAVMPKSMLPDEYFSSGFMGQGKTVEELANNLGIDAKGLQQTVSRFNEFAETGKDLDFQRGDAAYDRYYGDPENTPNPCLAKIVKPPFHAIRLDAGDFGTQGGMMTNVNGQVCDEAGNPIAGLYASGNCTAAVLPTYPGPGSTLGPAMTFGYVAARHIANTTTK
ncbi:3-oxosteroid 1-dehydrogenase [BD1-7 clade bacterium]|uniref:3-oxosteroid 1-dehydrogenase n=1 Tax=BD1-7 clade bacterium TaxID=2029982 RepID=A0A5S9MZC5_9GAMM|nr:3-oxosteroid 1-dehydrogenase [BD1-7 clade bacterium]